MKLNGHIEQALWARAYASAYDAQCRIVDTETIALIEEDENGFWEIVTIKGLRSTQHVRRRVGAKDAIRRAAAIESADAAVHALRARIEGDEGDEMSPERTVALQDLYNVMDALTRVPFKNEALEEARLRVRAKLDEQQTLVPARLRAERILDWIRASIREMPIVEELRDILAQNQAEPERGRRRRWVFRRVLVERLRRVPPPPGRAMKTAIIEDGWKEYEADIIPADAPEVQRVESRRAFYAGAFVLFQGMLNNVSHGPGHSDADDRLMEGLKDELEHFYAELKAGRA